MKIKSKTILILLIAISLFALASTSFAGWNRGGSTQGIRSGLIVSQLYQQDLSEEETNALLKMREEEKLARDVYTYLYELYNAQVFKNIAASEQRHMDTIARLITQYGLNDPVAGLDYGEFASSEMQELYTTLTTMGATDLAKAYQVGATIEDLDIKDLEDLLEVVDNTDIKFAFQNLMKGSRNHLRAFTTQLKNLGQSYTAQYLSQEEVDNIISTPWERGAVDENGNPISRGRGFRGRR